MNFEKDLSEFFLLITLVLAFVILFVVIQNFRNLIQLDYKSKLLVLTSVTIALAAHETIHFAYMNRYNSRPLDSLFTNLYNIIGSNI